MVLGLLDDVETLAPAVRGIHLTCTAKNDRIVVRMCRNKEIAGSLTQIHGDQNMGRDALGSDANDSSALGMNAEVLVTKVVQGLQDIASKGSGLSVGIAGL